VAAAAKIVGLRDGSLDLDGGSGRNCGAHAEADWTGGGCQNRRTAARPKSRGSWWRTGPGLHEAAVVINAWCSPCSSRQARCAGASGLRCTSQLPPRTPIGKKDGRADGELKKDKLVRYCTGWLPSEEPADKPCVLPVCSYIFGGMIFGAIRSWAS
jgi:hypothetical protein